MEGATGRGRPLRFLAVVAVGWIGVRIGVIWSETGSLPEAIHAVIPFAAAAPQPAAPARVPQPSRLARLVVRALTPAIQRQPAVAAPELHKVSPGRVESAMLGLLQFGQLEYLDAPSAAGGGQGGVQPWYPPAPSRWSASAWAVLRPGTGVGAAPGGGQLGGSQAGVRIAWLFDAQRRLSLYARATTPLEGRGREAAVGIEWQPSRRVPVRLAAEQRFGLDGTPGGPALGAVAGYDGTLAGFRLEAYGQAGVIKRNRYEPYADGAARMTRPVYDHDRLRVELGGGAWGAAQRDAARFDVGPSATLAMPVGTTHLRVMLDWRQRLAGDARPGSGPALTLGGDF